MLVYDATCDRCGAPLRRCVTLTGGQRRNALVDAMPSPAGTFVITGRWIGGRELAVPFDPNKHDTEERFPLHPFDCSTRKAKTT